MKRELQRAVQGWKKEFVMFWGRFNAFQRIVIGILLAMVLVYAARVKLLDPMRREVEKVHKTLEDEGVPAVIPTPERDDEIQQDLLRIENFEENIKEEAAEKGRAEAQTSYRLNAGPADAQAALIALATKSGLRVHENRSVEVETQTRVPHAAFACELRGALFTSIFRFLNAFSSEPYLWELDQISLELLDQKSTASVSGVYQPPVLSLRFLLRFYIYGKETTDDQEADQVKADHIENVSAVDEQNEPYIKETDDDQKIDQFEADYVDGVSDDDKEGEAVPDRTGETFYVYRKNNWLENQFIPSGWMGDIHSLSFNNWFIPDHSVDATYVEITYNPERLKQEGWAGIYWQSSENNWGARKSGYDLRGYNKLIFSAKGAKGGEVITKVKVGGIIKDNMTGKTFDYPDSLDTGKGPIRLSARWQEYFINLAGKDLSYVNGGFALIFSKEHTGSTQTIHIGNIRYVYDPGLTAEDDSLSFPFHVYTDYGALDNHFVPSGWMPGSLVKDLKMDTNWIENPYRGESCIKIEYRNNSGIRWAGIAWQEPANNWGAVADAGYNLRGAKKLTFWAKGEQGGEIINEFKVGGLINGAYPDSGSASIFHIQLTDQWKKYEINLHGTDLSHVIGGFGFSTSIDNNDPDGVVFYIDEIKYED